MLKNIFPSFALSQLIRHISTLSCTLWRYKVAHKPPKTVCIPKVHWTVYIPKVHLSEGSIVRKFISPKVK